VKSPFDGQWFFSYPAYQRLKASTANSVPILARSGISEGILQRQSESSSRVRYQLVSENFFEVLGLSPASGRFFDASDKEPQSAWPVVLRYGYWKESFGADRSIIGKQAAINGVPIVIDGIRSRPLLWSSRRTIAGYLAAVGGASIDPLLFLVRLARARQRRGHPGAVPAPAKCLLALVDGARARWGEIVSDHAMDRSAATGHRSVS
jgi:hypothetical protein